MGDSTHIFFKVNFQLSATLATKYLHHPQGPYRLEYLRAEKDHRGPVLWRLEKMPPQNTAVVVQDMVPQICRFGVLIIVRCGHLKNSKCRKRLSLNSPFLLKDRSSKRSSVVINSLPGSFTNQGGCWLPSQEGRLENGHHTQQTLSQATIPPSVLLRAHSSFLKVIYSPLCFSC